MSRAPLSPRAPPRLFLRTLLGAARAYTWVDPQESFINCEKPLGISAGVWSVARVALGAKGCRVPVVGWGKVREEHFRRDAWKWKV